jgi:hypothetical protein
VAPSHQQIDSNISLRAMLQPGNDANRFRTDRAAVIVGYVVSAKGLHRKLQLLGEGGEMA